MDVIFVRSPLLIVAVEVRDLLELIVTQEM